MRLIIKKRKKILINIAEIICVFAIFALANQHETWKILVLVAVTTVFGILNWTEGGWSQEKICDKYHTFRFYEEMYKEHMKGHDDK